MTADCFICCLPDEEIHRKFSLHASYNTAVLITRTIFLFMVILSFQALAEQVARSAQAWTWRGVFRPALYGLEALLWIGVLVLSFTSPGKRLLKPVERAMEGMAAWKGWNWLAVLAISSIRSAGAGLAHSLLSRSLAKTNSRLRVWGTPNMAASNWPTVAS